MYVKLFGTILTSSIWAEDPATRLVWITMLALADEEGFVRSSPSGLARIANVPAADTKKALKSLEQPDIESSSQEYGGRRIEPVEGGWLLLNYEKYREIRTEHQLKAAARQRRSYYRRKREDRETSPTSRTDTEAEADTEAEVKKRDSVPMRAKPDTWLTPFDKEWAKTHGGTPFLKKGAKTGGELGKWLKIVKREIAEEGIVIEKDHLNEMFKRWRSFLAEAGIYATPGKFAKEHGLHKGGKFVGGRDVRRAVPREPASRTKTKLTPTISRGGTDG